MVPIPAPASILHKHDKMLPLGTISWDSTIITLLKKSQIVTDKPVLKGQHTLVIQRRNEVYFPGLRCVSVGNAGSIISTPGTAEAGG